MNETFGCVTMARRVDCWADQLEKFRLLRAYKHRTWRILLSDPAIARYVLDQLHAHESGIVLQGEAALRAVCGGACDPVYLRAVVAVADEMVVTDTALEYATMLTAELAKCVTDQHWIVRVTQTCIAAYAGLHAELVQHNVALLWHSAKRYGGDEMPFEDKVCEGTFGLARAVHGFDPERGVKFSTYACWWIKQAITRATQYQARLIRLPVHMHTIRSKLNRAIAQHTAKHGQPPELADLEALGFGAGPLREYQLLVNTDAVSIDAVRAGRDGDTGLSCHETIADPQAPDCDEMLDAPQDLLEVVEGRVAQLSALERDAFWVYAKLSDDTLEIVGKRHGLSRERIRQIGIRVAEQIRSDCKRDAFVRRYAPLRALMAERANAAKVPPPPPPLPCSIAEPEPEDADRCYECHGPMPAELGDARRLGWHRVVVLQARGSHDVRVTVELCKPCSLEHGYRTATQIANIQRAWANRARSMRRRGQQRTAPETPKAELGRARLGDACLGSGLTPPEDAACCPRGAAAR